VHADCADCAGCAVSQSLQKGSSLLVLLVVYLAWQGCLPTRHHLLQLQQRKAHL
jgi:hypothetical protein